MRYEKKKLVTNCSILFFQNVLKSVYLLGLGIVDFNIKLKQILNQ